MNAVRDVQQQIWAMASVSGYALLRPATGTWTTVGRRCTPEEDIFFQVGYPKTMAIGMGSLQINLVHSNMENITSMATMALFVLLAVAGVISGMMSARIFWKCGVLIGQNPLPETE